MSKWSQMQAEKAMSHLFSDFSICEKAGSIVAVVAEKNTAENLENLLDIVSATFGQPHNFKGFQGDAGNREVTLEEVGGYIEILP